MPPIRAVHYGRKSDEDEGDSIKQQQEWAHGQAAEDGALILRDFADQSLSGTSFEKRTDYHRMLAYCQEQAGLGNPIEAIYVWHTNRLSRADSMETAHYLHEFRKACVRHIRTAERWFDFDREEDRMMLNVQQDFTNHKYSKDFAAASLRGRLDNLKAGRPQGGAPPYGYRPEKEEARTKKGKKYLRTRRWKLGPPAEVETVRWIFEAYSTGDWGLRRIAEELNRHGTPAPAGGLWNHQTVRRILSDEVYLGRLVWNRQQRGRFFGVVGLKVSEVRRGKKRRTPPAERLRQEATHAPIVDEPLFQRCAGILATKCKRGNPRAGGDFPLSGRCRCGHCGSAMTGRTFPKVSRRTGERVLYRRYECTGYMTHGKAKCHFGCIDADALAVALLDKLLPDWLDENREALRAEILRQDRGEAGEGQQAQLKQLRGQVERLEAEIGRATSELLATDSPKQIERLQNAIKDREAAQAAAEGELRALEGRRAIDPAEGVDAALDKLERLRRARDAGDRKSQKAVLHEAITRIEIYFNREQRGQRTRSTFAKALFWVPPDVRAVLMAAGLSTGMGSPSTGS